MNRTGPATVLAAPLLGAMALAHHAGLARSAALGHWFAYWHSSPLAAVLLMAGFAVLSFAAVPQFVLIAMSVMAFGPVTGLALAWLTTMLCAGTGFYGGAFLGDHFAGQWKPAKLNRIRAFLVRNGFWSAFLVRFVPSGPFVMVNMALGASGTPAMPFLLGTGFGVLPKMLLIALAGSSLWTTSALSSLALIGAGAGWLGLAILAGKLSRQQRRADETGGNRALAS